MKWPTHPPAPPLPTEAELTAHAKRTEAKRAKIEALERAERELPEASEKDCHFEMGSRGSWYCEWPKGREFDPFLGVGETPAKAHSAMLEKLQSALEEKRLRDEDGERMNDAMMRARDAMVEDGL